MYEKYLALSQLKQEDFDSQIRLWKSYCKKEIVSFFGEINPFVVMYVAKEREGDVK